MTDKKADAEIVRQPPRQYRPHEFLTIVYTFWDDSKPPIGRLQVYPPADIVFGGIQTLCIPNMDPFGAESELVNIHTTYAQGQYSSVLSDFQPSSFSDSNRLPVQILQYRAQCALGQYTSVLNSISSSDARSTPDLAAVKVYAQYLQNSSSDSLAEAERLAESQGDNLTVQLLCGTVLARAGKPEQAVQLLSRHQGSLDAVALIVQIHLSQNRTDLAVKEAKSARGFAQDALLVNLAESWIGLRQVHTQQTK